MQKIIPNPYFSAVLISLISSVLLTYLVRLAAGKLRVLDVPGAHKQHGMATPTLGGLAMFFAFGLTVLTHSVVSLQVRAILGGGLLMVGIGLLDDLRGVSANIKLAMLGLATVVLFLAGVKLRLGLDAFPALALIQTFLWIGLVSSAFNGIDNADGAAAGIAVVAGGFAFVIAWCTLQVDLALIAVAMGGAAAGFLWFNFPRPRATIFMGDSGSFFLGFVLSAMLVVGKWSSAQLASFLIGTTLLAVPLFDFLMHIYLRGAHGLYRKITDPITMCAQDHLHHRLVAFGLSKREAVLVMYLLSVACGTYAVAMIGWPADQIVPGFMALLAVAVVGVVILNKAPLPASVYDHLRPPSTSLAVNQAIGVEPACAEA